MIGEARNSQLVDVRGEFLSIFLIESCEISLQAYFLSLLIHQCIFLTTTNGQQKFIAATNNKNVPLINDDSL